MGAFELDEFPDDEFCQLGVLGGYCYLNASLIRLFGERAPGLSWRAMDEQFFGVQPGIPDYEEQPGDRRPDLTAKLGETFAWVFGQTDADRSRPPDRSSHDDDRAARPPSRPHRDVRAPAVGALRAPPAGAPRAVRRAHLHVVHGVRAGGRDQHHRRCGRAAGSRAGRARRHRRRRLGGAESRDVGALPDRTGAATSSPTAFGQLPLRFRKPRAERVGGADRRPGRPARGWRSRRSTGCGWRRSRPLPPASSRCGPASAQEAAEELLDLAGGNTEAHGTAGGRDRLLGGLAARAASAPRPTASGSSTRCGCRCARSGGGWSSEGRSTRSRTSGSSAPPRSTCSSTATPRRSCR